MIKQTLRWRDYDVINVQQRKRSHHAILCSEIEIHKSLDDEYLISLLHKKKRVIFLVI